MKKREKKLLIQLLKNSKLSDREIAKKLDTSQSTITRNRHKLEKKILKNYTGIPEFKKLGINLVAFTFGRCIKPGNESKKIHDFLDKMHNIIFSGHGEGMGKTAIVISIHKDFSDYTSFINEFRRVSSKSYEKLESFFVSTDGFLSTLNLSRAVEHLIGDE